jgi:pyrroline-5-carboxylate reductase
VLIKISASCKPQLVQSILGEKGMAEALEGKLLISILAGVTIPQLANLVQPTTKVIRAMPNTPCKVRHCPSTQTKVKSLLRFERE